ncbi:MAG: CBS domain-containing protein, partial [Terriglobia bacterium]
VQDAVVVMAQARVGAVAVVERAELKGIFTERDLMLRVVHRGRDPRTTTVREVMTSPAMTASDKTTFSEALNLMLDRHLRHLPILGGDGQLLGMLSIRDLLQDEVEHLSREIHSMDQYLLNDGPGG